MIAGDLSVATNNTVGCAVRCLNTKLFAGRRRKRREPSAYYTMRGIIYSSSGGREG